MDEGHKKLVQDLTALLKEAEDYQFHDFKNTDYAAPKMELTSHLQTFIELVKSGNYDN